MKKKESVKSTKSVKNVKDVHLIAILLLFVIVIVAILKFNKFQLIGENGATKVDLRGEQTKSNDSIAKAPGASSSTLHSAASERAKTVTINSTEGDQSPIVNNSNGSATISYGAK